MNCAAAQTIILNAERPVELPSEGGELGEHLASCAQCAAMLQRLIKLEAAAATMPLPAAQQAKEQTKARLCELPARRFVLRPAWIGAVAALLVVGIGLGIYLGSMSSEHPAVVDQLIDLDLELASVQQQQRQALYERHAPGLEKVVKTTRMSEEDRQLAMALLRNGQWLTGNADPLEQAERFSDIADVLVDRMDRAARAKDGRMLQKLGRHYGRVMQVGIGPSLEKADAFIAPPHARLERLANRNAGHQKKLQAVLDASPRGSEKEVRKALEASRRQKGQGKKPPATQGTERGTF